MEKNIAIVGAGHAGVAAAQAARQAGASVTLYSAERVLPYYRPRLVALAFGQADFAAIQMHPADWYAAQNVDLRLDAPVEAVDSGRGEVVARGETRACDGIILASGAAPLLPAFAAGVPSVLPLWNFEQAQAVGRRVRSGGSVVVLGGGILGIETALRATDAGMRVGIVEWKDRLMPDHLGAGASAMLRRRLEQRKIAVTLGRRATAASEKAGAGVRLTLDDGRAVEADFCLVSVGARPDCALAAAAGLNVARGVVVDDHLRTSAERCFAAGDLIQFAGLTRCSVREAVNQGRLAGANLAAALAGKPPESYRPQAQPILFKSGDLEFCAVGEPGGSGCEERVLAGATDRNLRVLVLKDGILVGVQMIGTREGFDEYARTLAQARLPDRDPVSQVSGCLRADKTTDELMTGLRGKRDHGRG